MALWQERCSPWRVHIDAVQAAVQEVDLCRGSPPFSLALNLTHVANLFHKHECSRVMLTVATLVEDGSAQHLEWNIDCRTATSSTWLKHLFCGVRPFLVCVPCVLRCRH